MAGIVQATFTPPLFADDTLTGLELRTEISDPVRSIYFKIVDHEFEDTAIFFTTTIDISSTYDQVYVQFETVNNCITETLQILICYSYGSYTNLQDLCDQSTPHTIINALGECISGFELSLDAARVSPIE